MCSPPPVPRCDYRRCVSLASVYLSARFERRVELTGYRVELETAGGAVTSRWLTDPTPEPTDDACQLLAEKDVEDICRAEGPVSFAEPGRGVAGGRHAEFGVAVGLRKRRVVVGGVENLFHRLPSVEVVETWQEAFKAVAA